MATVKPARTTDEDFFRSEAELEAFVVKNPHFLEEGLRIIDHQTRTKSAGIPDVIGVDAMKNAVIMELKNEEAGVEVLAQALRYHNWAIKNMHIIERLGQAKLDEKFKLNMENLRLFLVAPTFDEDVRVFTGYLKESISIELFTYKCIKLNEERAIVFEKSIVEEPEGMEPPPRTVADLEENAKRVFGGEGSELWKVYCDVKSEIAKLTNNHMETTARKSGDITFFPIGIRRRICTAYIYKNRIEFGNPNEPEKFNVAISDWKDYMDKKNELLKKLEARYRELVTIRA